ncbi:MAG: ribosome recycling factor [Myxococcales bacterium]|nr:ribosome recycling factor [Myxococcales bacterium]
MIDDTLLELDDHLRKSLDSFKRELAGVRTGRASAHLLDHIRVDYYGTETPINQLATVNVPEARMIVIQPWDKGGMPAIEKALRTSDLGLNPQSDGSIIRLVLPTLTEERRKDLVKHVKKVGEDIRVAMRNSRRHANEALKKLEKSKEITEDDLRRASDEVQKETDKYIALVDKALTDKEAEILHI